MTRVYAPEILYGHGAGKAVVVAEGKVESIGEAQAYPHAIALPRRILLPGLVNAHSHAFHRAIRGMAEDRASQSPTFWSWRDVMYRAANRLSAQDLFRVARMAFLEMALSGVTTVGEFHYVHREPSGEPSEEPNALALLMVKAAREVGLRICLLRVAYERAGYNKPPEPLQRRFIETPEEYLQHVEALRRQLDGVYAWTGAAPHSVRAVGLAGLQQISEWARSAGVPLHMHVAEQPQELAECQAEYSVTPVELLSRENILSPRFTAVHGIHLSTREIAQLGEHDSFVCACPTTERNLGDGIVPADQLLRAGVRIALGTDSQAQIDLMEDARELEYHLRLKSLQRGLLSSADLVRCATQWGAESLGVPTNAADFFTLDLDDPSVAGVPEEHLLFAASKSAVRDVIVGGQQIVQDGHHPRRAEIVAEYLAIGQ